MKALFTLIVSFACLVLRAQSVSGTITGNLLDDKGKAVAGASIRLVFLADTNQARSTASGSDGSFEFSALPLGYYRINFSFIGLQTLTIDSISCRPERHDFLLNEIVLKANTEGGQMDAVIIFAEKPLIESRDGNITFNAAESPLSAGSNASDLLTNVPLITKDPSGKLLVRGKEPKILIDDKPVELNLQQLQDLLESMPGSSIEKIEVMTNPPPQYATESGGVINIVTRKGTVGMNGRVSIYGGTRGEAGANVSFNYRKQGLSINVNAGAVSNYFEGGGYSHRQNIYADSINYSNNDSRFANRNRRPNVRVSINYDINKLQSLSLVLQYNGNDFRNGNFTEFQNLNRLGSLYRLSDRTILSPGHSSNPYASFGYLLKTKRAGESLRITADLNYSTGTNTRNFYQQYLNPDRLSAGRDSTLQQFTDNHTRGYSVRLNYDRPLGKKTTLSIGGFYTSTTSRLISDADYLRTSDKAWTPLSALINDFRFHQTVNNFRLSLKQVLGENFSATGGLAGEWTRIHFDLLKAGGAASNDYWSYLPFASINRNWKSGINLSLAWRRTIRRPGVTELNPTVDSSDAYNVRSGNIGLRPSLSHNFDLVAGHTGKAFYANVGLGYNIVDDVFASIRTRLTDTTTRIMWENISGRKEYEISTWSGYSLSRQVKINLSASYIYSRYGAYDKQVRNYRNGGSFTSNLNTNYSWKDLYTATGSFTYNRFANPQGTVRSTVSMNIGLQARLLRKKLIATINFIDPFVQQESRTYTYGTNFNLESLSRTNTRNYRLSIGYTFSKKQKKKPALSLQQALKKS